MSAAILQLAVKSLFNRRLSAMLTILAVALSASLFLGVDKVRSGARAGFESTLSDADLIVGARSGAINLLLYSVFRLGDPTANISWESYELVDDAPGVAWTIPLSLGDSHRGYRVLGTTEAYFEHYRTGRSRPLEFAQGAPFSDKMDVVLGAEVARALRYELGRRIVLSHGIGEVSFADHDDHPFLVVGVLAPTGTPVDRTVHVPLEGIEAMHEGWETGAPPPRARRGEAEADAGHGEDARDEHAEDEHADEEGADEEGAGDGHDHASHDHGAHDHGAADESHADEAGEARDPHADHDHSAEQITAFIVGMESPVQVLRLQRQINTYEGEALSAVIPGVALAQLWSVIGVAESALYAISAFVVVVGLISVLTSLSSSVNERRREMAILRAVGARPGHIFSLLVGESALLAFAGAALGIVMINGLLALLGEALLSRYGLFIGAAGPGVIDLAALVAITIAGAAMGAVPGWRALRNSLADGLSIRL